MMVEQLVYGLVRKLASRWACMMVEPLVSLLVFVMAELLVFLLEL